MICFRLLFIQHSLGLNTFYLYSLKKISKNHSKINANRPKLKSENLKFIKKEMKSHYSKKLPKRKAETTENTFSDKISSVSQMALK